MELARLNQVDIAIDVNALVPHPYIKWTADAVSLDWRKLMLTWGSWELVFTFAPENRRQIETALHSTKSPFLIIGECVSGTGQVNVCEAGSRSVLNDFSSKRFEALSSLTSGIEPYMHYLFDAPLAKWSTKNDKSTVS